MIRRKEDEVEREDTDRVAQANCYCQLEIVVNYCVLALKVELENVLIGNVEQMVAEGSILRDHIALHFTKVKWKYSQQKIAGGMGGNTAGGWDLSCNKSCA